MKKNALEISHALRFLRTVQEPDGELSIYASSSRSLAPAVRDSDYFTTAQVVYSLGFAPPRSTGAMRSRGLRFLEAGRERGGVWRYWTPKARRHVDPDADVTACVATVLELASPDESRREQTRAALVRCRDARGRFLTWVREPERENDVDAVVQANVLWLLGPADDATRGAVDWLLEILEQRAEDELASYYESPVWLYHAISRAMWRWSWSGPRWLRDVLRERAVHAALASESCADAALGVCTLLNLEAAGDDSALDRLRERIRTSQRADGSWPRVAAWNGPELRGPRTIFWGSEALSTALCVEALSRLERLTRSDPARRHRPGLDG